jgi:HAE1 family hydrophobic/amphiphilic exporter-1
LIPALAGAIRVSDVAQLTMGNGPSNIQRFNRQRQITVYASLDGMPLGEGVTRVREKVSELNLKPGYGVVFTGNARTLATASNDFAVAMLLAVAFIYMVLASQFNSLIHPLTIMTALPLSLPAGLLALLAFGMTLNVYSAIGMLMLFGIVKKNSASGLYEHAARRGDGTSRSPDGRQPRSIAADPHDHDFDRCRHDADRPGPRCGRGLSCIYGSNDYRGADAVPSADTSDHPCRLLLL